MATGDIEESIIHVGKHKRKVPQLVPARLGARLNEFSVARWAFLWASYASDRPPRLVSSADPHSPALLISIHAGYPGQHFGRSHQHQPQPQSQLSFFGFFLVTFAADK